MVAIPIASGFARPAIDHQVARALADFFVEVVHQHAHGGFLLPAFTGKSRAAGSADGCVGWNFSLYRHELNGSGLERMFPAREEGKSLVCFSARPSKTAEPALSEAEGSLDYVPSSIERMTELRSG